MVLFIDTTDFNKATFAVAPSFSSPLRGEARGTPKIKDFWGPRRRGWKIIKKSYKIDPHKSHETLQKLDEFLKRFHVSSSKLHKIVVCKGPGSFTGIRVGVTLAQALGFAWKIPLSYVFKKKGVKEFKKGP